jgi:hypothetical protein
VDNTAKTVCVIFPAKHTHNSTRLAHPLTISLPFLPAPPPYAIQALVDDTAKAVGLVTGNAADAATAAQDAVAAAKEKLADAQWQMDSGDAPNIPAEAYTNTQDLIKARQAEAAQEAARGTAYRTSRGDPV